MTFDDKIAEQLLIRGIVSESKLLALLAAVENRHCSLEEAIIADGAIDHSSYNSIKSELSHVPPAELSGLPIDRECYGLLPAKLRRHYQSMIFRKDGDEIKIAMVKPWDFVAHEALHAFADRRGLKAKYYSISLSDFNELESMIGEDQSVETAETELPELPIGRDGHGGYDDKSLDRLLRLIVSYAVEGGAIKVHLEGDGKSGRARFRLGNRLHNSITYPESAHRGLMARLFSMIGGESGRCKIDCGNSELHLAAEIIPLDGGSKAVIEAIDLSISPKNLRSEGFSLFQLEMLRDALSRPGIILVSSENAAERKAALYGLIGELNASEMNIVTIESSVSAKIPGVCQSAANPATDERAEMFSAFLRHDIDAIMTDAVDSGEILSLAEMAARRGKLVLIGAESRSLSKAISDLWRLSGKQKDLIDRLNIALHVKGVKRICRGCIRKTVPRQGLAALARTEMKGVSPAFLGSDWPGLQFYRGAGCSICGQTGFKGGALISEIWPMTPEFKGALFEALSETGQAISPEAEKYATIMQDGLIKASYGLTVAEEAIASRD